MWTKNKSHTDIKNWISLQNQLYSQMWDLGRKKKPIQDKSYFKTP